MKKLILFLCLLVILFFKDPRFSLPVLMKFEERHILVRLSSQQGISEKNELDFVVKNYNEMNVHGVLGQFLFRWFFPSLDLHLVDPEKGLYKADQSVINCENQIEVNFDRRVITCL